MVEKKKFKGPEKSPDLTSASLIGAPKSRRHDVSTGRPGPHQVGCQPLRHATSSACCWKAPIILKQHVQF